MESGTAVCLRLPYSLFSPHFGPDYRTGQGPRTSIACDAARRVTRGAAYLFPPAFLAVVGFFVGRFVAGVFFGLLAFRVTLGGAFAVFTADFIAFAIVLLRGLRYQNQFSYFIRS